MSNRRSWHPVGPGEAHLKSLDGFEWTRPRGGRPRDPDSKHVHDRARPDPTPAGLCSVCRRLLKIGDSVKCGHCANRAGVNL